MTSNESYEIETYVTTYFKTVAKSTTLASDYPLLSLDRNYEVPSCIGAAAGGYDPQVDLDPMSAIKGLKLMGNMDTVCYIEEIISCTL